MRSALLACAALAFGLAAQPALCSTSRMADEYYQVRDKAHQLLSSFDSNEVQTHPRDFDGKLIELRGVITAVAGSEGQTTLLIGSGDQQAGSPTMVALPPGTTTTTWPILDVGVAVRVLCQVVTSGGGNSGALELVRPVKEAEAQVVDQARQKAAEAVRVKQQQAEAAKRRKSQRAVTLASRKMSPPTYYTAGQRFSRDQLVDIYASAVHYFNHSVGAAEARTIADIIIHYSREYDLDARLVMAVIAVESNFNSSAVSRCGAMGLGQLMPGTASYLGVGNAYDVQKNLEGSTRLLSTHIRNLEADGRPSDEAIKLALACYNAGAAAVKKYKGIPPYRETQAYVAKISRLYNQMCGKPD